MFYVALPVWAFSCLLTSLHVYRSVAIFKIKQTAERCQSETRPQFHKQSQTQTQAQLNYTKSVSEENSKTWSIKTLPNECIDNYN